MKRVLEKMSRDELVLAVGAGRIADHNLIQMIGIHGGFDCAWFDMEHIGLTTQQLEIATLAARSQGFDTFARLAPTDYASVTRCMEAGAGGVMAAQIFTAEQAAEFVRWSKFFPEGQRGLNTGGWDAQYGTIPPAEFCQQANADSFVAIQIETASSVDCCGDIAAIDGVDMLFIGPSDLSQSLGVTGDFWHERCLEAIDRVANACKQHGKHLGAVVTDPRHARMLIDKGCRMISPTNDIRIINAGIQAAKAAYSEFFPSSR